MRLGYRNRWSLFSYFLPILISIMLWVPTSGFAIDWSSDKTHQNLWHFRNEQYVRLEPQQHKQQPNQHPVNLDAAQLRTTLASLQVDYRDSILPAFVRSELDIIVEPLQRGLAQAQPHQDVTFAVLGMHPGLFANENRLVTGRVFYQADRLHIIFGALQGEVDYHQDRRIHPFLAGNRQTPQTFERALQLQPGQQLVGQRQDWIALDIAAVLDYVAYQEELKPEAVAAETAKVQQEADVLRQEVQQLKQTVATLQRDVPQQSQPNISAVESELQQDTVQLQNAVSELQEQVQTLKQQQIPSVAMPAPAMNVNHSATSAADNEIEARLRLLKDLREKDLITEQEYQQKRREILESL